MAKSTDSKRIRAENPNLGMHEASEMASSLGFQQQKELVEICCALASNPQVFPQTNSVGLVTIAKRILRDIEIQSKTKLED
jgi:hypothetical protein